MFKAVNPPLPVKPKSITPALASNVKLSLTTAVAVLEPLTIELFNNKELAENVWKTQSGT